MLLQLLLALPVTGMAPTTTAPQPSLSPAAQEASIDWFPAPLYVIKAKAKKEKRGVLFVTVTEDSDLCNKLMQTSFADPMVIAAMAEMICVKIDLTPDSDGVVLDKNSERIASLFPVSSFPTILYLGSDLKPEDKIAGFIQGPELAVKLKRMASGTGTLSDLRAKVKAAPKDIEALWTLAKRCGDFGYATENQKLLRIINNLDPDGLSRPVRLQKLQMMQEGLFRQYTHSGSYDHERLFRFLRRETHPSVAFTGWSQLADLLRSFRPDLKAKKDRRVMGLLSRDCYREAWKVAATSEKVNFAVSVLGELYVDRKELKKKDLELVRQLVTSIQESIVDRSDTPVAQAVFADAQAVAAYLDEKPQAAANWIDKAIKLDPSNPLYVKRKQELAIKNK